MARGRVTVAVQLQSDQDQAAAGLDPARLETALAMVKAAAARIEKETGKPQEITLDHLLAVPDVFRAEEPELDPDDVKTALMAGLAAACAGLQAMKAQEGAALEAEMRQRLDTLVTQLENVRTLAPQAAEEIRIRLEERLAKLMNEQLEPQRLAQEVAIIADKANINEECERLGIHIEAFRVGPGRGRAGGQAHQLPAAGDAPRGQHHGLEDQHHGHHHRGDRHEGRGRIPARADPEPGVGR